MTLGRLDGAFARAGAAHAVGVVVVVVIVNLLLIVVFLVIIVVGDSVLDALGQTIAIKGFSDVLVLSDGGQKALIYGLARVGLLHNAQHTVIKMLVKLLCVGKGDRARRASASHVLAGVCLATRWALLAAVRRILLDTMNGSEMPLEDIGAVKALLRR